MTDDAQKRDQDERMAFFHAVYDGAPPWDIGRPQPDFVAIAGSVRGSVLDVGCGTGEHALFFAGRGHEAWGIDMVPAAIALARAKAAERGLQATFVVGDALALDKLGRTFDHAFDSGLFHVFDDETRPRYVDSLRRVLAPGGVYHMLVFSEHTPGTGGPRRVTQAEIRAAFAEGWTVREIVPATFEVRDERPEPPKGWRATIERTGAAMVTDDSAGGAGQGGAPVPSDTGVIQPRMAASKK